MAEPRVSRQGARQRRAYAHGADLERAARNDLTSAGYPLVIKSGGSRGPVDVIALRPGSVVLVQCKLDGYLSGEKRYELWRLAGALGAVPVVAFWAKEGRAARRVGWRRLVAGALVEWAPGPAGEVEVRDA